MLSVLQDGIEDGLRSFYVKFNEQSMYRVLKQVKSYFKSNLLNSQHNFTFYIYLDV